MCHQPCPRFRKQATQAQLQSLPDGKKPRLLRLQAQLQSLPDGKKPQMEWTLWNSSNWKRQYIFRKNRNHRKCEQRRWRHKPFNRRKRRQ